MKNTDNRFFSWRYKPEFISQVRKPDVMEKIEPYVFLAWVLCNIFMFGAIVYSIFKK